MRNLQISLNAILLNVILLVKKKIMKKYGFLIIFN